MPTSNPLPPDICLLLRADAERSWLAREVIPVLLQVQARERPCGEDVDAARAYLEAMWEQAQIRARATDGSQASGGEALSEQARRYHASVCALRERVGRLVAELAQRERDAAQDGPAHRQPQPAAPAQAPAQAPAAQAARELGRGREVQAA